MSNLIDSVKLTKYAQIDYKKWTNEYSGTWKTENVYPIYLFSNGDQFDHWILSLYADIADKNKCNDDRYDNIDKILKLKQ